MFKSVILTALAGVVAAPLIASPALAAGTTTGNLAGAVRDTRGAIVADADITILVPESPNVAAQAHTDAAGRFKVTGLDEGAYNIQIDRDGWTEWAPGRTDSPTAYAIRAGRTTVANSVVYAAGRVTGKVTTATGAPAAGVQVSAEDDEHARSFDGTTATDGTYSLRVAPNETYVLRFTDGHFTQFAPSTAGRDEATRYAVGAGRTVRVSNKLLAAATLTGTLTDVAGAPVAGAQVNYIDMNAGSVSATTDAAGHYTIDKLAPGDFKVYFLTSQGQLQWAYQALGYDEAETFTLPLGGTATVDDQLLPIS
ncbi:carboxypeptidase-like regulatory domain-containing protein [Actinoplanes sp. NPDC026619]|uniref:carboxypeptidase-like regulatory domain-containing protein n=1 Tax=Actinoplanes sp. NPDC026619 TaxID=3155798 RepID=UPI0033F4ECAD